MNGLILAGIVAMSLFKHNLNAVSITINIPAQIGECDVEIYPIASPNSPLYPKCQFKDGNWVYSAQINYLLDSEWICLVSNYGKIGLVTFIPNQANELTIDIYDIPAPVFIEQDSNFIWTIQMPESIQDYIEKIELHTENGIYDVNSVFNELPSCAYAKIYFVDGGNHWALSKSYY